MLGKECPTDKNHYYDNVDCNFQPIVLLFCCSNAAFSSAAVPRAVINRQSNNTVNRDRAGSEIMIFGRVAENSML